MVSAAAVTGESRAARFGSEQYNSGMALTALAKKLFRTLARVFPQCGMVSQAVAFNMFLAFFAVLLDCAQHYEEFLGRRSGVRHADFGNLPPGSSQLISA